jgi:arsenate reductase (glutaredoxin)
MIQIYHNKRCSKSRDGFNYLSERKLDFEVIYYLETGLAKQELIEIIKKLNIKPIDLVRKKEKIWIEQFKGKNLNDQEIIDAMIENLNLIERPIVIYKNNAVIARPTEKIVELLQENI